MDGATFSFSIFEIMLSAQPTRSARSRMRMPSSRRACRTRAPICKPSFLVPFFVLSALTLRSFHRESLIIASSVGRESTCDLAGGPASADSCRSTSL